MQAVARSVASSAHLASASLSVETSSVRCQSVSLKAARAVAPVSHASSSEFTRNALMSTVAAPRRGAGHRAVVSMAKSPAAIGYAKAFVDLGKSSGSLEALHNDIEALSSVMSNKGLADFFANPTVEDAQKKGIIKQLATDIKLDQKTQNFLNLLVDKRRIYLLQDIAIVFEELYCESTDTQVAIVTSAVKLENAQQALIAKKLQSMTGARNIKLKNIVDTSLIAGFIVKYGKDGSSEIDMSVKGQLDRLAAQFENAERSLAA
eukprot:TRINITY_DN26217_c0_g1_i1.p1 TRINITY_DN26217_c0_g1~~TRINITY_DN26217_c0_g1_i1.p1  ORF type:complete len:263 (-),score=47.80 TRINITY_DN26217_c0_g1_i1:878-1666(-)